MIKLWLIIPKSENKILKHLQYFFSSSQESKYSLPKTKLNTRNHSSSHWERACLRDYLIVRFYLKQIINRKILRRDHKKLFNYTERRKAICNNRKTLISTKTPPNSCFDERKNSRENFFNQSDLSSYCCESRGDGNFKLSDLMARRKILATLKKKIKTFAFEWYPWNTHFDLFSSPPTLLLTRTRNLIKFPLIGDVDEKFEIGCSGRASLRLFLLGNKCYLIPELWWGFQPNKNAK